MQLQLRLSETDDLIRVFEALEFSPLFGDICINGVELPDGFDPRLQELIDRPLSDAREVYGSLKAARAEEGVVASLHVHLSCSVLLVRPGSEELLADLARSMELYSFCSDNAAHAVLKSLPFHSIEQIHGFYDNSNPHKILVLSSPQTCDAILSNDPASFLHMVICPAGLYYSLAGELHGFRTLDLQRTIKVLHSLSSNLGERIPLAAMRAAIRSSSFSYSFFADHYDSYMAHVNYDAWIANLITWHKQYGLSQGKKALELACGTANISSRMMVKGYTMDACDISAQMLINAAKKQVKPRLWQASLCDPIPGDDYDLIFCLFDSINYLCSSAEIQACFKAVSKALKPGGIFIFDISTLLNSLENFADNCNFSQSENYNLVHEAWYEAYHRCQISRLSSFEARGPAYAMQREEHQQRVYLCSELMAMIESSPLQLLAIRSTQGKVNLMHKRVSGLDKLYARLFFILSTDASSL